MITWNFSHMCVYFNFSFFIQMIHCNRVYPPRI